MIDSTVLYTATKLKKEMDAAYIVFRKDPTVERAALWTTATTLFNDFCVKTINSLIEDDTDKRAEILANIDEYKICKQCGAEVLYLIDDKNFVTNINFVEDFPGWCFDCLVKHCTKTECKDCTVSKNTANCPFAEVKRLHTK